MSTATDLLRPLSTLQFRKEFVDGFPGDTSGDLRPRQTPGMLYSLARPTPVSAPRLLAWSAALAAELGIEKPVTNEEVDILTGNRLNPSMQPYAACYAGHQFGNWAGQLGDGRAITLGELETPSGGTHELQLKGAGPTAYSRRADGRAVLRSSVREYLMSEAMHYLGVPTTRALSLAATGEPVLRDMFYDGHPQYEPGAIVLRVAPTFLRFGNFELLAARGETDLLRQLVDWTIARYFPDLTGKDRTIAFFREVVRRTAVLVADWLRVGFVHGVMNTDNMSILGLTIDYGPYSFVDHYDPMFTPNTTDLPGRRYAFGRQPSVAYWNLGCLGGALSALYKEDETEELKAALAGFEGDFAEAYNDVMGRKLGLDRAAEEDIPLIKDLEQFLATVQPDMTLFFQLLMTLPDTLKERSDVKAHFNDSFYNPPTGDQLGNLHRWLQQYRDRLGRNTISPDESRERMRLANPRFILRNYLLHQAIEGLEQGNDELFLQLQEAMKAPYTTKGDAFLTRRPDWAGNKAGCSMLSCSS